MSRGSHKETMNTFSQQSHCKSHMEKRMTLFSRQVMQTQIYNILFNKSDSIYFIETSREYQSVSIVACMER